MAQMAPDTAAEVQQLVGKKIFGTSVGTITGRKTDDGFEINAHTALEEGNRNTTFVLDKNGRELSSKTVISAYTEQNGQVDFGALSIGYFDPKESPAVHSLREILAAAKESKS